MTRSLTQSINQSAAVSRPMCRWIPELISCSVSTSIPHLKLPSSEGRSHYQGPASTSPRNSSVATRHTDTARLPPFARELRPLTMPSRPGLILIRVRVSAVCRERTVQFIIRRLVSSGPIVSLLIGGFGARSVLTASACPLIYLLITFWH